MEFSRRSCVSDEAAHDVTNALSRAVTEARARGRAILDLTVGNPTSHEVGLPYDEAALVRALAHPSSLTYEPDPLGLPSARRVVARHYEESGIAIDASHIAITASTSEAYAALFKTFCDPGDEVLVPTPSYPLLAWLAAFEGVVLRTYPLEYAGHWHVDLGALARAVGRRTRLVVVVSPNNPTGSYVGKDELEAMLDLGLPIVSDEVFATYPLVDPLPSHRVDSILRARRGLVFALSGLSKLVGLPQMKLGWIACGGERSDAVMERLSTVLDAYLSVGAPVQHALPELLRSGRTTADAIRRRTRANLTTLRGIVGKGGTTSVLDVEGGWYATLRVPETRTDEEWAVRLVETEGVHVQPGYFFDMARGAHLVVSLLTSEDRFREGVTRLVTAIDRDA